MTECVNCAKFKGCDLSSPNVNECADYKEILTNEEWLRSCTTEQLAEFIRKQRDDWSDGWYSDWHNTEEIVKWLKEIHHAN